MKDTHVLWQSLRGDDHLALEIRDTQFDMNRLSELVESVLDLQPSIAFVFLRVDHDAGLDLHRIGATIKTLKRLGTARLCLAGRRGVLKAITDSDLDSDRIGLMLDDVDVETPLSELVWDRIEAVRFKPEFVVQASSDLRKGCVLKSMLSLCGDIGLCTLGLDASSARASPVQRTEFDYVRAIADRASMARAGAHDLASPTPARLAR